MECHRKAVAEALDVITVLLEEDGTLFGRAQCETGKLHLTARNWVVSALTFPQPLPLCGVHCYGDVFSNSFGLGECLGLIDDGPY